MCAMSELQLACRRRNNVHLGWPTRDSRAHPVRLVVFDDALVPHVFGCRAVGFKMVPLLFRSQHGTQHVMGRGVVFDRDQ